jgi:hypothetical protein
MTARFRVTEGLALYDSIQAPYVRQARAIALRVHERAQPRGSRPN